MVFPKIWTWTGLLDLEFVGKTKSNLFWTGFGFVKIGLISAQFCLSEKKGGGGWPIWIVLGGVIEKPGPKNGFLFVLAAHKTGPIFHAFGPVLVQVQSKFQVHQMLGGTLFMSAENHNFSTISEPN